jgi:hypothetical protein
MIAVIPGTDICNGSKEDAEPTAAIRRADCREAQSGSYEVEDTKLTT